MKTLILIAMGFLFIGCTNKNIGYISQGSKTCKCSNTQNITFAFDTELCQCGEENIIKKQVFKKKKKVVTKGYKKVHSKNEPCPTEVTVLYTVRGETMSTCQGKLLVGNQKTRIIRRKK